eukprot:3620876-Prymnesium_polylepis.1
MLAVAVTLTLTACGTPAQRHDRPQSRDGGDWYRVRCALLADASTVAPGQAFDIPQALAVGPAFDIPRAVYKKGFKNGFAHGFVHGAYYQYQAERRRAVDKQLIRVLLGGALGLSGVVLAILSISDVVEGAPILVGVTLYAALAQWSTHRRAQNMRQLQREQQEQEGSHERRQPPRSQTLFSRA